MHTFFDTNNINIKLFLYVILRHDSTHCRNFGRKAEGNLDAGDLDASKVSVGDDDTTVNNPVKRGGMRDGERRQSAPEHYSRRLPDSPHRIEIGGYG